MTQVGTFVKSAAEVTKAIHALLDYRKNELGLKGIYYGLQELIPEYPAVMLESGTKARTIQQTHRFDLSLSTVLLLVHGKLQSSTITREETEILAERVEDILHEDHTLGGLVIFGFVRTIQPGSARIEDVMYRATRLVWEGLSKEGF